MNCLYITLFFNIVDGIVQTFIKSWNQLLYSPSHRSLPSALWTTSCLDAPHHRRRTFRNVVKTPCFISRHNGVQKLISFLCVAREKLQRGTHLFRSYDGTHHTLGGTLDSRCHFKHVSLKQGGSTTVKRARITGKDQGRRQHNKFSYRPTRDVSLLSGHASYYYYSETIRPVFEPWPPRSPSSNNLYPSPLLYSFECAANLWHPSQQHPSIFLLDFTTDTLSLKCPYVTFLNLRESSIRTTWSAYCSLFIEVTEI